MIMRLPYAFCTRRYNQVKHAYFAHELRERVNGFCLAPSFFSYNVYQGDNMLSCFETDNDILFCSR
jgi:hypothetical protein